MRVPWRRGRLVVALAVVGTLVGGTTAGMVAASPAAGAATASTSITITGHGWGHGHGMGQWGAFGYAIAGTGYLQIVDHYYGGTSDVTLPSSTDAQTVRVALTENDGNDVIVTSGSPFSVAGNSFAAGSAVLLAPAGGTGWTVQRGGSCGGPWQPSLGTVTNPTVVPSSSPALGDPATATKALQLCQAGSNLTVRGDLEATFNSLGQARTVNILPLEQYVAGVVPNESPAYWGTLGGAGPQGQAWGFQELEAQAIAARSYVLASPGSYGGYADTCDLTCQTYRGTANETTVSDAAVMDTAGQVMEFPGGTIAATQYSASTGGYTNPAAFPAVPDTGDAVCIPEACNPNHTWTVSVPASAFSAAWPSIGTFSSAVVTARNGYGDWGGRVESMVVSGSAGSVTVTGDEAAAALGLRSNWFTLAASPVVGMAGTGTGQGYWLASNDGDVANFGNAGGDGSAVAYAPSAPIVGMAATPDGGGYWLVASDGGIFTFGDAGFYGSMGGIPLNAPVVGLAVAPGTGVMTHVYLPQYPAGSYGVDISKFQDNASCTATLPAAGPIRIVEVNGLASQYPNPCLSHEARWAGNDLNLYTFLSYGTSAADQPGCNGDQACNFGYQAAQYAVAYAASQGVNTNVVWWLDIEGAGTYWSSDPAANAQVITGALAGLHAAGPSTVGIYTSVLGWKPIVGSFQPNVPLWVAWYTGNPGANCATAMSYGAAHGDQLPDGGLWLTQYTSNGGSLDGDYAC